jgi:hypothetical protein
MIKGGRYVKKDKNFLAKDYGNSTICGKRREIPGTALMLELCRFRERRWTLRKASAERRLIYAMKLTTKVNDNNNNQ